MEYLWDMYGISVEYVCDMYVICVENQWDIFGICMGISMGYSEARCGLHDALNIVIPNLHQFTGL